MILPGLISLVFYKRPPRRTQVILGLIATIVLSAALGYISPPGPLGVDSSIVVAIVGGVAIYFAILAYLQFRYYPKHAGAAAPPAQSP